MADYIAAMIGLLLDCPACREEDDTTIVKAPLPTALLPHSPAPPSMVAYVMYEKLANAVPFYRQEMDWLHAYLLERELLHADETVCQVLHEGKKQHRLNPICGFI